MNRSGLTLLELVVSITIGGMAVAIGYEALGTMTDHRERAAQQVQAALAASAIRSTLSTWLSGAQVTGEPGSSQFRGSDGVHDDLPDDDLQFLSTSTHMGGAGAIVRLAVDRDPETPQVGLLAVVAEWRGTRREMISIDSRVIGLDVRYLSNLAGQRWLPSWISSTVLPSTVELQLVARPDDPPHELLRFPLLVAMGSPP